MAKTYRKMELTKELLDAARSRAASLPVFEGSHRKRQANIVGCIGEVVFERLLEKNGIPFVDHRESTQRDYVVNERLSLEVTTKDRTVRPKINFDNSVPLYNHEHQRPDFYYFVSLYRVRGEDEQDIARFREAYLLGGIDLETLDRVGRHWNAGDTDPANGTKFWTACINVSMEQLLSNEQMLRIFTGEGRVE